MAPGSRLRRAAPVVALALGLWVLMWWRVVVGGQVVYHNDVPDFNLPVRAWVARALLAGRLPLWCPDLLTGVPLVAHQSCQFAPTTWLMTAAGARPAWWFSLVTASVYLVAWAGVWVLARRLGLRRAAAALAATAFAYCSPLPARHVFLNMLDAMVLLPWLMLGVDLLATARGHGEARQGVALAGAALGLQMLAFFPQITLFSVTAAGVYGLARGAAHAPARARALGLRRTALLLLAAAALGSAIGCAQYLPFAELAQWNAAQEPRGAAYMLRYAPRARQMVGVLLPGYWGNPEVWLGGGNLHEAFLPAGIVVFGLVLAALGLRPGRFPLGLLLGIAAGAVVVSLPTVFQSHRLLSALPFVGTMRALGRCWLVASWALALGAGWAAQELARQGRGRRVVGLAAALGAVVLALVGLASALARPSLAEAASRVLGPLMGPLELLKPMQKHWAAEYGLLGPGTWAAVAGVLGLAVGGWLAMRGRARRSLAVLGAALVLEAWHVVGLSAPTTQPGPIYARPWTAALVEQRGGGRLVSAPGGLGLAVSRAVGLPGENARCQAVLSQMMVADRPLLWGLARADGYVTRVLMPRDLRELLPRAGVPAEGVTVTGAEARRRAVVLGLLGARFLVGPVGWGLEGPGVERIAQEPPVGVWELKYAQDPARLVGVGRPARDEEEARRLTCAGAPELLDRAVVEAPAAIIAGLPSRAQGRVSVAAAAPGYWDLRIATPTGGLVVLTDRAYPGWHAWVDGRRAWWGRAYGALKCVAVPMGDHRATLVYWPISSVLGQFLLLVGAAGVAALGLWSWHGRS